MISMHSLGRLPFSMYSTSCGPSGTEGPQPNPLSSEVSEIIDKFKKLSRHHLVPHSPPMDCTVKKNYDTSLISYQSSDQSVHVKLVIIFLHYFHMRLLILLKLSSEAGKSYRQAIQLILLLKTGFGCSEISNGLLPVAKLHLVGTTLRTLHSTVSFYKISGSKEY